eukprot:12488055-Alexandrium_andersonii.AAC.1
MPSLEQPHAEGESTNAELLLGFCANRDLVLPASWRQRSMAHMVTYRAPGVEGIPKGDPDPAKYAELDLVVTPRRWDSVVNR